MTDIGKLIGIILGVLLVLFIVPWVIMLCWNAFVPAVLHFVAITYWQAFSLFLLSRLLFGSTKIKNDD